MISACACFSFMRINLLASFCLCSVDDDTSPFGPLTQRLIQGLMEESLVTPLDDASVLSDAGNSTDRDFLVFVCTVKVSATRSMQKTKEISLFCSAVLRDI
jgi:hypothetical protein